METAIKDYSYVKTVYLDNKPTFDIWESCIICVSGDGRRSIAKFKTKK